MKEGLYPRSRQSDVWSTCVFLRQRKSGIRTCDGGYIEVNARHVVGLREMDVHSKELERNMRQGMNAQVWKESLPAGGFCQTRGSR